MKRVLTVAIALSLLAGTAVSAKDGRGNGNKRGHSYERSYDRGYDRDEGYDRRGRGAYRDDRGRGQWEQRQWSRGQRLPGAYRGGGVDYRRHQLRRPPRGYQWVRVGDDYVLSATATGLILDVITGDGY